MSGEVPADGLMEALRECDRQRMGQVRPRVALCGGDSLAERLVTVQTYTAEPVRHVLGPWRPSDLEVMEADRDDALTENLNLQARLRGARKGRDLAIREADRLRAERDAHRTMQATYRVERAEAKAENQRLRAALAVAGDELRTAQAEAQRLRGGLHDLADRWEHCGADGAKLARIIRRFLDPQETDQ